ncbi:MAG: methionyl-tRNA formyltransferase [Candidatus Sericytochromatia bacterium]
MEKIKIVFMGTPDFAVPSLQKLLDNEKYEVRAVFTQPDKPVGRKMVLTPPPVKVLAEQHNIPVFQPAKMKKNQEIFDKLKELEPDFIVVVAYGKILPQIVLDTPKYFCLNVHGSLLEKYRGAAPIQWSVANGEKETGVTTMKMDIGMDTGDMLLKEVLEIKPEDTSESLFNKLSIIGADLLIKTLEEYLAGNIKPIKQDEALATYAPIINKNDGFIDWSYSAEKINNYVRAFTPWPSVYTVFNEKNLKILSCELLDKEKEPEHKVGEIVEIKKDSFLLATSNKYLWIKKVQLAGSKEMSAGDFCRGQRIQAGFCFA